MAVAVVLTVSSSVSFTAGINPRRRNRRPAIFASTTVCTPPVQPLDRSALSLSEAGGSEDELWAAACLRVRSFSKFRDENSFGIQDHKKYLAEREFVAIKERIAGKRIGFIRVSCINATLPLSHVLSYSDDLSSACKFSHNGEDRVVVGSLDINQCIKLPDEITGKRPQGIGADFARAYLSNVCVAKEFHRKGLGRLLVAKSKEVAEEWGISDLYVHVAIDNEPAKNLYIKSGFVYENDEPAWQARFLDRPRRILLWTEIPNDLDLFLITGEKRSFIEYQLRYILRKAITEKDSSSEREDIASTRPIHGGAYHAAELFLLRSHGLRHLCALSRHQSCSRSHRRSLSSGCFLVLQ